MATSVVWLRDDLRLADNPALSAAAQRGGKIVVLYVLDEQSEGIRPLGSASKWWLHHSLESLAAQLAAVGGTLILRRGCARDAVLDVTAEAEADAVFWNRRYGLAERRVDAALKEELADINIEAASFQANLLFEPWTIRTGAGGPYKVFTPFWRACSNAEEPRGPLSAPESLRSPNVVSEPLANWKLLPTAPDWSPGLSSEWTPGEIGAHQRLADFGDRQARDYATDRDFPAIEATSRLSPHLRFGEISPFQIRHALRGLPAAAHKDLQVFRSELGWREFCWHLLYFNPDLATANYRPEFDQFAWASPTAPDASAELAAWRSGRTGYPLVDAGMRQLWQTGWMHNRIRMVTASFLVKNLLLDWRIGEQWFWDTLVDADAANNPANWQWVAGSGADASPYFRIFNPVTQSRKFDPDGLYLRRYVPELASFGARSVHEPWKTPDIAGDYPAPLVELGPSRQRALDTYAALKEGQ
ncbi:cryptochrome/photolyase family protein [Arthrobacter sp. H14-L1]|uniref:cryptochrome/photolyase family protein n=1 Tax=Arthrobacter sp. H14-L1 TaxID=2996697 RepID=UPI00226E0860|nr:deoxyribodipyrimidine photo-lyase [Arthrobacter sp. H14-L1]MCY0904285.1 deoxyribodipyrimidine photo-lyase [Arthrobacter sp. H14-L1]